MSYDGGRGPERVTGPRVDVLLRPQGVRVAGDFDATTSAWVGYQLFEHLEHHREKLGGVRLAGGFVVDLTRAGGPAGQHHRAGAASRRSRVPCPGRLDRRR